MRSFLLGAICLLWLAVSLAHAQNAVPTHPVDGEYIKEWLVLGPFFPNDLEKDFLADVGGEANANPKEGDTVITADGKTLTWRRYTTKGNVIDFWSAVGYQKNATAYAFCRLQSESDGRAEFHLGSDDGVSVWINGKRAHRNPVERPLVLDEDVFEADLKAGANRCLIKVFQEIMSWRFGMRLAMLSQHRAVLTGEITDEAGAPIASADIRLEQDGKQIAKTQTDSLGRYRINVYPVQGRYDLSATSNNLGDWRLGVHLRENERRQLNLRLKEAVSIEGTLWMLDDTTPHVAVPVQAVIPASLSTDGRELSPPALLPEGEGRMGAGEPVVIAGTLSDENGKYRLINLKPGQYQVRCQLRDGFLYYRGKDGDADHPAFLGVERGRTARKVDFHFAPVKKGTTKHYTYLDGLADNEVRAIYQNPDGVLWFGTSGGVSRFDGQTFVNFTTKDGLVHNIVTAIHRAPDGVMWFGTYGGISRYDGKEFVNFTTEDGLPDNWIKAIYQVSNTTIWFATALGGISRYDGQSFQNFTSKDGLADNSVIAIHRDSDGTLWFGTWGSGVSRYDGKAFVNYTAKDGLAHNHVGAIHQAPDGVFWFGTHGGISRYDGKLFKNLTTRDGLIHSRINDIYQEPNGVLWFWTWGGGVSRYNGETFVNFPVKGELADSYIGAIYQDRDGVFWFASENGVSRYNEKTFITFTTQDGLVSDTINVIHQDRDGVLWIGTENGVSRYDGKRFTTFTTQDGLPDNTIYSIYRDVEGNTWFGTSGGVSRYDGKQFVNFTTQDGLADNLVKAIHQDRDGTLWFGTSLGLSRYIPLQSPLTKGGSKGGFVNFTTKDGLIANHVRDIYQTPDGVIWLGAWKWGIEGGVSRYDGNTFVNLTTADGLVDNRVNAIHRDRNGAIWFGTGRGVSRYDGKLFENFPTQDELANSNVSDIYEDGDGVLWFGTSRGVFRYDGISWTSLDIRDGLAGRSVSAIVQDLAGRFWFGTDKGLVSYQGSPVPPSVRIVSVQTDQIYTADTIGGKSLQAIPSVTAGGRVTIEYNAIDLKTVPEKRQYRICIIEGTHDGTFLQKDADYWLAPTREITFDHTFDKPGTHTFAVQAIDRDLNYSEPATLTFKVVRPWWHYALAGFVGISIPLILIGFYVGKRLQTQRAIAQQFNPYIAGRVVGEDLFYGRSDLLTDIERTLANNCFLLYGERRIGKTSLQHQLLQRLQNAEDPTYRFIPAYIDLQGVAEDDFFRTIAASVVEHAAGLFREPLGLRANETREGYTYRDLTRDLRTILDHLKEGETKTIKLVLLMDEVDTLNTYSLRTNLNLRGLFMGPLKENLVLVMSGLYLKMDWSEEGSGSPPFNFLSREIQLEPLDEDAARKLITEPVKGFYTYEPKAVERIIEYSELRPFTIQGLCTRAVNRILADGRTKITASDIEAIKDSALAELLSIRGERPGTSLPASLNEALSRIADLEMELARMREETA